MKVTPKLSGLVKQHNILFLLLGAEFVAELAVSQAIPPLPVEVLSDGKDFQIPCKASFTFNQVHSFNWLFNGTFIHPSLNPGVTVLTDGSLNIDSVQPDHTGKN